MNKQLSLIIFLIIPLLINASFINSEGKPYPETDFRKTNGKFGAELVITHKEKKAFKNWDTNTKGVYLPTSRIFHKGQIITALVVFKGCKKLKNNNCQLSQKFNIYQPDGKIYGDIPESELWFNRLSPLDDSLGLGTDYIRLIVEKHEQVGEYIFEVFIKDYQSNKILKLIKKIEVVE